MAKKPKAGMGELLGLLKTRPELVHALILDHKKVRSLLKTKEARRLIPSEKRRKAVHKRVDDAESGSPGLWLRVQCLQNTTSNKT